MSQRRILYLDASGIVAFFWQKGTLVNEGTFESPTADGKRFATYLRAHHHSQFSLLLNIAEESFHVETIPLLRGANRRSVVDRKLTQRAGNAGLRTALVLGQEKARRSNERILLATLGSEVFPGPWLEVLKRCEVALCGIHSLPLLAGALYKLLRLSDDNCLLLSVHQHSIRQTYLENGKVHFSRLAPLDDDSPEGIARTLAAEAARMQQYLLNQRLLARSPALRVYIIADSVAQQDISAHCLSTDSLTYCLLDIAEVAQKIGLKTLPAASRCETLFIHLQANGAVPGQFADTSHRRHYLLQKWRQLSTRIAQIVLLAGLLFGGAAVHETGQQRERIATLGNDINALQQQLDAREELLPPTPIDADALHRLVSLFGELENGSSHRAMIGRYREISRAMAVADEIRLDHIDWSGGKLARARGPTASRGAEQIVVRGRLQAGAPLTPRRQQEIFGRFVEALRSTTQLPIEVQRGPLDPAPGKVRTGLEAESENPGLFMLTLRRENAS